MTQTTYQHLNFIVALLLGFGVLLIPAYVAAQGVDPLKDVCDSRGARTANKPAACEDKKLGSQNPIYGPDGILTKVVNILSILTGIAAVIAFVVAGLKFITSGSNSQDIVQAREWAIYALIGLVIAALAQLLIRMVLLKTGVVPTG